tara:strand:- start:53 stop:526 length:474 start_codon:yes stop_codon:yes gene_type:complete
MMVFLKRNGHRIGGGEMDRIIKDTTSEVSNMQVRFRERAKAITGAQVPPLEGEMRRKWIAQKEADYQDFLMIADCDVEFTDGILHLSLDLRPKICDATIREQGVTADGEAETQVAMKNIAKASTFISGTLTEVVKEIKPIEITDNDVLSGRNLHKEP